MGMCQVNFKIVDLFISWNGYPMTRQEVKYQSLSDAISPKNVKIPLTRTLSPKGRGDDGITFD
jgi:hypothetical protein